LRTPAESTSATHDSSEGRRARWIVVAGVVGLTLAIIGPLLRPGTVLLLDWVPGPQPRLSSQFWGFPPGPPNRTPIELVTWAFGHVVPWGVGRLLPLALAPALAAWGLSRLLRPVTTSPLVVVASTLMLVVNPFMYDRMLAGHLYLVDGIALLPLLLSSLNEGPGVTAAIRTGLIFAALTALSLHFVFVAGVVIGSFALACLVTREAHRVWAVLVGIASAVMLSLYWIIPAIFVRDVSLALSAAHVDAFRSQPDSRFGLLPNLIGLNGFWRSEWPSSKSHLGFWILPLVVIVLVAAIGLRDLLRRPQLRVAAMTLAISGVVGAILALGNQGPTGRIFVWLFANIPGFAAMRESQKFLALLVVAYAPTFGWGLKVLSAQASTRRAALGVIALLLLTPLGYGFRELWGFAGWVRPSTYPESWSEADRVMGVGEGRVLVLPWHQYLAVPFANGRIVANPAREFFRREVFVSDDPEVPGIESVAHDDAHRFLDRTIRAKDKRLGPSTAGLGVEFVLLQKYVDYRSYAWLEHQVDLVEMREWDDLVLYRNGAYVGSAGSTEKGDPDRVRLVARSPVRYEVLGSAPRGPLRTAILPADDWQYGAVDSRQLSRSGASFPVEKVTRGSIRYRPWRVVFASYLIGAGMLALALLILIRTRSSKDHGRASLNH
jgi:hypothetical protein